MNVRVLHGLNPPLVWFFGTLLQSSEPGRSDDEEAHQRLLG